MNKHFEDTKYYLRRATETAKRGVTEELEPLQERFDQIRDTEEAEVESSRIEELRSDLGALEEKAEGEAKEAIADARSKLQAYRES